MSQDVRPSQGAQYGAPGEVAEVVLDRQHTAAVRARIPVDDLADFLEQAFSRVEVVTDAMGVATAGPPYARLVLAGDALEVEAGYPVDRRITSAHGVVASDLPGGRAASVTHVGSFDEAAEAYDEVERWLRLKGYVRECDPWEVYVDEPGTGAARTIIRLPYLVP